MTIDSHVHFWKYGPVKDAWITNDMKVIQRDFLPADALHVFAKNDVDGCVAVQADQSESETRFLLDLAAKNDFIKGVVGWTNLTEPNIDEVLETYSTEKKLKGFRHIAQGEDDGFLIRKDILRGIAAIGAAGFTYDILVYHHQLHDAIRLCERLPGQPFILNHCAKPALRSNTIEKWKTDIRELAQNPDAYCKASGLLTEDHWHNCNEKQLVKCLDTIFENFGTNRILFGSDWPVVLLAGDYARWKTIIKNYTTQFTAKEQENIFGGNAMRIYNF